MFFTIKNREKERKNDFTEEVNALHIHHDLNDLSLFFTNMAMKLFSKYTLTHIRYTTVRMFQNMSLIWLNANENTPDHQNTLAQLRRTVHSIETFTDRTKCIEFLENIHDKKACMIISGSASQQIVPQIHNLDQLDTIFIFC